MADKGAPNSQGSQPLLVAITKTAKLGGVKTDGAGQELVSGMKNEYGFVRPYRFSWAIGFTGAILGCAGNEFTSCADTMTCPPPAMGGTAGIGGNAGDVHSTGGSAGGGADSGIVGGSAGTSNLAELVIKTSELPHASFNKDYVVNLEAVGGDGKYEWTIAEGSLPRGVALSRDGRLQGRPAEDGAFVFKVRLNDASEGSVEQSLTLKVDRKRWLVYRGDEDVAGAFEFYAVDVKTGSRRKVNIPLRADQSTAGYGFSSDGRYFLYTVDGSAFLVDFSGDIPGEPTEVKGATGIVRIRWSAAPTLFAYSRGNDIYVQKVGATAQRVDTTTQEPVFDFVGATVLAYGAGAVFKYADVTDGIPGTITTPVLPNGVVTTTDQFISKGIETTEDVGMFVRRYQWNPYRIDLYTVVSSGVHLIGTSRSDYYVSRADGLIAYVDESLKPIRSFVKDAKASILLDIEGNATFRAPAHGRWLAYTVEGAPHAYVLDTSQSNISSLKISLPGGDASLIGFSPDGEWLALKGGATSYVIDMSKSSLAPEVIVGTLGPSVQFDPQAEHLMYIGSNDDVRKDVYRVNLSDAAKSAANLSASIPRGARGARDYEVSKDGAVLYMLDAHQSGQGVEMYIIDLLQADISPKLVSVPRDCAPETLTCSGIERGWFQP